jgi:hypothetical protein
MSPDGYAHSYWTGIAPARPEDTVQVQRSHIMPSSWEDDVDEGSSARIARTDEVRGLFSLCVYCNYNVDEHSSVRIARTDEVHGMLCVCVCVFVL